ncbi:MAG: hypothetical protein NZ530_00160 [Thermodesulfobacteriaceae bacterium]|nr:hypothetical protein [Thermodesulfobacteriaceae bacterium]
MGVKFLREFERYLEEEGIEHYFNYLRNPKENSSVKRFNRRLDADLRDLYGGVVV